MAQPNIDSQIRDRVDAFVSELTELVRAAAFESVHEVLAGVGLAAPAKRGPGRPAKNAGRKATRAAAPTAASRSAIATTSSGGKRVRRSADDLASASSAILDVVKANPGIRSEDIRKTLGVEAKDIQRPVSMLLAEGKLRSEGEKRGTRYFAGGGRSVAAKKTSKKRGGKKRTTKKRA